MSDPILKLSHISKTFNTHTSRNILALKNIDLEITPGEFFKWQGAYGAFTVNKDGIDRVEYYINHQKQHHAEMNLIEDWERCETEDGD